MSELDPPQHPPFRRVDIRPLASPRLEFMSEADLADDVSIDVPFGGVLTTLLGLSVIVVGIGAIGATGFVADQFARGPIFGWTAIAVAVIGFSLIAVGIRREMRGLFALHMVDQLRVELASAEPKRVRQAAHNWIALLPNAPKIDQAIDVLESPEAIRALLKAKISSDLRASVDRLGHSAGRQSVAILAVIPSAELDALAIGWRGIRLVRQVAELHGLRPGTFATLALLRRTALAAISVAAADVVTNGVMQAVSSHPLARTFAGDLVKGGVAWRRLLVLARASSLACSPLAPSE